MAHFTAIELAAHGATVVGCALAWRGGRVERPRPWSIGAGVTLAAGVGLALAARHAAVALTGVCVSAMLALCLLTLVAPLLRRAPGSEARRGTRAAGAGKRGPIDGRRALAAFAAAPAATVLACLAVARWLPGSDAVRLLVAEVLVFALAAVAVLLAVAARRLSVVWACCGVVALGAVGALL